MEKTKEMKTITVKLEDIKLVDDKHSKTGFDSDHGDGKFSYEGSEIVYDFRIQLNTCSPYRPRRFQDEGDVSYQEKLDEKKRSTIADLKENFSRSKKILLTTDIFKWLENRFDITYKNDDRDFIYTTIQVDNFIDLDFMKSIGIKFDFTEISDEFEKLSAENNKLIQELTIVEKTERYNNHWLVTGFNEIKTAFKQHDNVTVTITPDTVEKYIEKTDVVNVNVCFSVKDSEVDNWVYGIQQFDVGKRYSSNIVLQLRKSYNYVGNYKSVESIVKRLRSEYEDWSTMMFSAIAKKTEVEMRNDYLVEQFPGTGIHVETEFCGTGIHMQKFYHNHYGIVTEPIDLETGECQMVGLEYEWHGELGSDDCLFKIVDMKGKMTDFDQTGFITFCNEVRKTNNESIVDGKQILNLSSNLYTLDRFKQIIKYYFDTVMPVRFDKYSKWEKMLISVTDEA